MLTYPHPLDYVTGLKYTLTKEKIPIEFEVNPDSFYVEEIIDLNKLGFNTERGEYAVLRLYKKGVEMFKALELLARSLRIPESNIYFYGIKDKDATTTSHLFVKSSILDKSSLPIYKKDLKVDLIGYIHVKPRRMGFKGNKFRVNITSQNRDHELLLKNILNVISEHGLPSYYGYQRFGWRRYNSHILGKYLILGREDLFAKQLLMVLYPREDLEAIYKRIVRFYRGLLFEEKYTKIPLGKGTTRVSSLVHNIYIGAYASYLFNLLINKVIEDYGFGNLDMILPMPGCADPWKYYESIFESENLDPTLAKKLPCFYRRGLFKPLNQNILHVNENLVVEFTLEPGMYATVVLREIFKEGLVVG